SWRLLLFVPAAQRAGLTGSGLPSQRIPCAETRPAVFQRSDSRFIRPIYSECPTSIANDELEITAQRSLAKDKFSDRRSQGGDRSIGACDLSVMMLGIISFHRSVLHRKQGAILCDS